ncbi:MAG: helix-turn-helix domain-containing protein, partial [Myxococcaceae bacterium]|nr:helix-turn-helix domain-containing protein [Myxococcaceae bacterium]
PGQLAQVLRGFRKAKGLTQAELARRGGLLPKTVSAVENDPSKVTFESLYRVLSALELDLSLEPRSARPPAVW